MRKKKKIKKVNSKPRMTGVKTEKEWSYHWQLGIGEYISVRKIPAVSVTKKLREGLLIDLDSKGRITGIEILTGFSLPTLKAKKK